MHKIRLYRMEIKEITAREIFNFIHQNLFSQEHASVSYFEMGYFYRFGPDLSNLQCVL